MYIPMMIRSHNYCWPVIRVLESVYRKDCTRLCLSARTSVRILEILPVLFPPPQMESQEYFSQEKVQLQFLRGEPRMECLSRIRKAARILGPAQVVEQLWEEDFKTMQFKLGVSEKKIWGVKVSVRWLLMDGSNRVPAWLCRVK